MKLLSSLASAILPVQSSVQAVFTALVVVAVVGLEWAGRTAHTDVQDVVYALMLVGLGGVVAVWHRRRPLPWVDWLGERGARLLRRLKAWRYEHGIDFRGAPPLPRKLPRVVWVIAAGLVVWAAAGPLVWEWVPGGWRTVGAKTSYVAYLVVLLAVWAVLLTGLMAGLFLPLVSLDRRLTDAIGDSDRRLVVLALSVSYLFVVTAAAAFVPVVAPLAVCGLAAGLAFGWAMRSDVGGVAVLWRRGRNGAVFAIPLHRVVAGGAAGLLLAFVALVLNGRGGRLLTPLEAGDAMPLTASLAALTIWTVPGLILLALFRVREKRRTDPANRTPPTVHVRNRLSAVAGERAARTFTGWGWAVRSGEPHADDIRVELVHPELSEATEFNPVWPLKIAPADLDNPLVKERLERRDEIRLRRRVFRGLTAALKRAMADRKDRGGGFLLAPHWWFVGGLVREDGETRRRSADGDLDPPRRVGPPYTEVFGVRPRQHLHRVLQAVQIDLIYVEDGVSLKSLERVFRAVFELYDVHAGQRRVDDHSFRGIPKVRVMVHEFSPLKPPAETAVTYRMPKFDDMNRGRVLHIFRDKGDHEELIDTPRDFDYVPSPSPMLVG